MSYEAITKSIEGPMILILNRKGLCTLYIKGPHDREIIESIRRDFGRTEFSIKIEPEKKKQ